MDKPAPVPTERNAEVHARHRHETQRQIYLPLAIFLVLVFIGVIAIIIYGLGVGANLRRWADVSLIWVLLPFMFIGVLVMIASIGVLAGVTHVLGILPGYGNIAQAYFRQIEDKVASVTDGIVEPLLRVRSSWAVVQRRNKIIEKNKRTGE